jgi:rod shape-determining protein MreC
VLDFDGTRRARRKDAGLSAVILVVALALLVLPAEYQRPIRNGIRASVLQPFLMAQGQVVERRGRSVDVGQLRAQRDSLAALMAAQASLSEENRQLRASLGLQARLGEQFLPANVIRAGLTSAQSTFIVDKGRADGVFVGSTVITADGLLGVVWEVDERSAQAIDWTHPDFRVSAMTADGLAYGLVEPRPAPGMYRESDLLALTGTAFQVDVRPGRRVVSSGRGGLHPRGIVIGTIIGIEEADTGWRKSYLVRPAVRPEGAIHVLVAVGQGGGDVGDVWQISAPPDPLNAPQGGGTN